MSCFGENEALLLTEKLLFGYSLKGRKKSFADAFDFVLNAGEVVALMGENGCGKSTLLKTLSGMIAPLDGNVILDGRPLLDWASRERARRVALVRMGLALPSRMSVREFVNLGRSPYSAMLDSRSAEDNRIVDESMELLDVSQFAERPVSELSDGERSRVYLTCAMAQQVKVMLLDEPNAFLDIPRSHALFRTLRKVAAERRIGIIVSMHSLEYAQKYCDRIMVIDNRKVKVAPAADALAMGLLDWTQLGINS